MMGRPRRRRVRAELLGVVLAGLLVGVLPVSAEQPATARAGTVLGVDSEEIPESVTPADASPLLGEAFRIAKGGNLARVAADTRRDRYLVVWETEEDADIHVQMWSGGGRPVSPAHNVSEGGPSDWEAWPNVVFNPTAREYLVVWQDTRESRNWTIFGRRVSAKGKPLGRPFRISGTKAIDSTKFNPVVTWNSRTNEYLVIWEDWRNGEWEDIYAQRVSATGQRIGRERRITRGQTETVFKPDVAYNPASNEYLVVWQDQGQSRTITRIYGQRVSATGTRIGPYFPISAGPPSSDRDDEPKVTYNRRERQYLVVFTSIRPDDTVIGVWGQLVSARGSLIGSEFMISDQNTSNVPNAPVMTAGSGRVAYNRTANQYLVIWDQNLYFPDHYRRTVRGRVLSSSGSPLGDVLEFARWPYDSWLGGGGVAWNRRANRFMVVWDTTFPLRVFGRVVAG